MALRVVNFKNGNALRRTLTTISSGVFESARDCLCGYHVFSENQFGYPTAHFGKGLHRAELLLARLVLPSSKSLSTML
jgi:hypothetical protein